MIRRARSCAPDQKVSGASGTKCTVRCFARNRAVCVVRLQSRGRRHPAPVVPPVGNFPIPRAGVARCRRPVLTHTLAERHRTLSIVLVNRSLRRLTALASAALLLLSSAGDAFAAHPCPHHAAIGARGQTAAEAAHGGGEAHHTHAASEPAPASTPAHDGHAACTCAGICPVSPGPAPLAAPVLVHLPLALPLAAPAAQPDSTGLPSRLTAHLLPFAQAPPQSA